ncbi:MAG TPA: hypothetical protein VKX25_19495 [Bryobacteraceae bacterium]|nr:hypothetical protein [Bryobacteraceae bacterium]
MKKNQSFSIKSLKMRGGARLGAGRKKGVPSQKTIELQNAVAESGITPLDTMLEAMRRHYIEGRLDAAAAIAKDAAPYVHPKLAAVEMSGPGGTALIPQPAPVINVQFLSPDGERRAS